MFGREECDTSGLGERHLGLEERAGCRDESGVPEDEGAGYFSDATEAELPDSDETLKDIAK